jgi:hypothetical protein
MDLLQQNSERDFYLFGTHKNFVGPREKILENCGRRPIDILFAVNIADLRLLDNRTKLPDTKNLSYSTKGWRRMINVDSGHSEEIPKEICLWGWGGRDSRGKKKAYYGLPISDFKILDPNEKWHLRCKNLSYYLNGKRLTTFAQFAWGALYDDPKANGKREDVADRRILATAKVIPPYFYEIRK